MNITGHEVEKLKDPTGILLGERFEFFLELEIPEDDELYTEHGVYIKVIFAADENGTRIAQYQFFEESTNKLLEFELEEDEEELIKEYCDQHYKEVL